MSPLSLDQQISHAWELELPGVNLRSEEDMVTMTVRMQAEARILSDAHNLTRAQLIRSDGEAARATVVAIAEQMRERALDAFGLRPLIEEARREERAKYEAIATQLDAMRAEAQREKDAAKAHDDALGVAYGQAEVGSLRRAAALIRAVSTPPAQTRGT